MFKYKLTFCLTSKTIKYGLCRQALKIKHFNKFYFFLPKQQTFYTGVTKIDFFTYISSLYILFIVNYSVIGLRKVV